MMKLCRLVTLMVIMSAGVYSFTDLNENQYRHHASKGHVTFNTTLKKICNFSLKPFCVRWKMTT